MVQSTVHIKACHSIEFGEQRRNRRWSSGWLWLFKSLKFARRRGHADLWKVKYGRHATTNLAQLLSVWPLRKRMSGFDKITFYRQQHNPCEPFHRKSLSSPDRAQLARLPQSKVERIDKEDTILFRVTLYRSTISAKLRRTRLALRNNPRK